MQGRKKREGLRSQLFTAPASATTVDLSPRKNVPGIIQNNTCTVHRSTSKQGKGSRASVNHAVSTANRTRCRGSSIHSTRYISYTQRETRRKEQEQERKRKKKDTITKKTNKNKTRQRCLSEVHPRPSKSTQHRAKRLHPHRAEHIREHSLDLGLGGTVSRVLRHEVEQLAPGGKVHDHEDVPLK